MTQSAQLEFLDFSSDRTRPPGGGQRINGFFIFNADAQRVDQVAYTISSTTRHVYHLIQTGEFPNAVDISSDAADRACYRVPRSDVIEFLNNRKEGSF